MSQSCLEVEVPTEAIEEMVTSLTCNEAFQHLKGGLEDRSKEVRSNSKAFKIRALEERQGHKPNSNFLKSYGFKRSQRVLKLKVTE